MVRFWSSELLTNSCAVGAVDRHTVWGLARTFRFMTVQ